MEISNDTIINIGLSMIIVGAMLSAFNIPALATYLGSTTNTFMVSLIGVLLPVTAIIAGIYLFKRKMNK